MIITGSAHQHRDPNYFHTDGESHYKKEQKHNQPEEETQPRHNQRTTNAHYQPQTV